MSDASNTGGGRALPATWRIAAVLLTAAVALASSIALAWVLRSRREPFRPPPDAASDRQAALQNAGRLAYQVHCLRCHGPDGHGDGSDAERLVPPPRDFGAPHWRFAATPDAVRQVIVAGIPGTAMPGWGSSLSRGELEGLVAHVLTMAPHPSTLATLLSRAGFTAEATPRPAPRLDVLDLDARPATRAERHGQPVMILFWGTTCAPCLAEMPAAVRFADRYRDRGLEVLWICVDESDAAAVRRVAGQQLADRPVYLDATGGTRLRYDVQVLPAVALIDRAGRLIARATGTRDWNDPALDALVRECLAPSAPSDPLRPTRAAEDRHAPRADRRPG
jgi:mono/diheme cytochrome c family protein